MAGQKTGRPKRIWVQGVWSRRGLLAVVVAVSTMAAGPVVAAQASTSAPTQVVPANCGAWHPATGEHKTPDSTLGVYLQESFCVSGDFFKVAVKNHSAFNIGSHQIGLEKCTNGQPNGQPVHPRWPAYIPVDKTWVSDPVLVSASEHTLVSGVIYWPRQSNTDVFKVEAHTGCIA
jgi:hypothetical protein